MRLGADAPGGYHNLGRGDRLGILAEGPAFGRSLDSFSPMPYSSLASLC